MARPRKSHTDLARHIVELLRFQGAAAGERVREQHLADHFGVSRTPVRAALGLLTEQGLLEYAPRRGYSLARALSDEEGAAAVPASEEDQLFRAVLRDRFANRLHGTVSVNELMRRYRVGRTPTTRVLARMSEEGLVERGLGQHWRFGPALDSLEAFEESSRFRQLIEPAALRDPGFQVEPALFRDIRSRHEALIAGDVFHTDMRRLVDADADFHAAIAACCANRFLAQAIRQQTRLRRLTAYQGGAARHRLRESLREHLGILDAVEGGDTDRAAELMRRHIRASREQRPQFSNRGVPPLVRPMRR